MNYTVNSIKSLFSNKCYVQAIMILPVLGILAVTRMFQHPGHS